MASGVYQGNKQNKVLYKAFAPSGRRAKCDDTQGDALGYELPPLQGVWGQAERVQQKYTCCCYHILSFLLTIVKFRNIHYTWSGFNSSSVNPVICMI